MAENSSGAINFAIVGGTDLVRVWPMIEGYVDDSLAASVRHEYKPSDVLGRIMTGEFLLAVVERDGELIGCEVFDMDTDPHGEKFVAIVCCGGKDMETWIAGMVALAKKLADLAGARKIVVVGRRGWARVLAQYGLKVQAVIAAADVADIPLDFDSAFGGHNGQHWHGAQQ